MSDMPFKGLERFGFSFLQRFEGVMMPNPVLRNITLIDTPGVLSGEKQRVNRGVSLTFKWLYLYNVSFYFLSIGALDNSALYLSYPITIIAHNHHTDIPLLLKNKYKNSTTSVKSALGSPPAPT